MRDYLHLLDTPEATIQAQVSAAVLHARFFVHDLALKGLHVGLTSDRCR